MRIINTPYGSFPDYYQLDILEDLCVKGIGIQTGPFGSQLHNSDYVSLGTPILTVEHLGENRILHENIPRVTDADRRRLSRYSIKKGDIIFSRVGSVDRRALVRDGEEGWLFSGRCLRVRPDPEKLDSVFLSYLMGLPSFKEYIRKIAVGATMPSINTEILSDIPICYPPLPTQHAIARILGSLDDKIELNRQMNATLEAMARAIFQSWFMGFDPVRAKAEGRDTGLPQEFAALFPSEMVEVDGQKVPRGWGFVCISECCQHVENGGTPRRDNPDYWDPPEIPWLTSGEVRQDIITSTENGISKLGFENSSAKMWPKGTTVVALYGATAGQVSFISVELCANQACCALIPKDTLTYFNYLAMSSAVESLENQASGSAQQNLSQKIVAEYKICQPSQEILYQFDKVVEPLFEIWISNTEQSCTLAQIRDALLPKLMSGEIQVT